MGSHMDKHMREHKENVNVNENKKVNFISNKDIYNIIERRLGKIATISMIKEVMRELPEKQWWQIDKFLKRRYPEGGNGYEEAERLMQEEKILK
jgi:hypothetical protein